MIRSNIILFLIIILCNACKAQELQVVVNDDNDKSEIEVLSLLENDTIVLHKSKPNFYMMKKEYSHPILIIYKQKIFKLNCIDKETKSIFIDYQENANNNCYAIDKMYNDAIQSWFVGDFNKCEAITNIYIYNHYTSDKERKQYLKFRIRPTK